MSVILKQPVVERMPAAANRAESTGRSYPLGATSLPDGVQTGPRLALPGAPFLFAPIE